MTTTLSIKIGALLVEQTFTDDAKVSAVLSAFYLDQRLGPETATNRQKLEAILLWFARYTQQRAQTFHQQQKRAEAEVEAKGLYEIIAPQAITGPGDEPPPQQPAKTRGRSTQNGKAKQSKRASTGGARPKGDAKSKSNSKN